MTARHGSPQARSRAPQATQARRQAALLRLSTGIAAAHTEVDVCRAIVEGLHDEALGYDFLGLFLVDPPSGDRVLQASVGWPEVPASFRVPPGSGLSEQAVLDKRLAYTPRVSTESRYISSPARGSEVDVPLLVDDQAIGVLVVEGHEVDAFGEEDFEILTAAANQASIAIARLRSLEAERRRADEQRALLDTIADLSAEVELSSLLPAVLQRAVTLLDVTGAELAIYDEAARELVVVASLNIGKDSTGTRLRLDEGAMGHVARTREPIIISEYATWAGRSGKYADLTVHAVMAAPLLAGQRLVGAIASIHSNPARRFGADDLRLLTMFAQQAGIAIARGRLLEAERRRANEQTALIDTMADLSSELELSKVLAAVLRRAVTLLGVT
ncbi:MAG TPA: GAF domain-containing protein, partial [Streptomyces sp.]|nr:GAF domain-containing protein [Streptomyces sp.]